MPQRAGKPPIAWRVLLHFTVAAAAAVRLEIDGHAVSHAADTVHASRAAFSTRCALVFLFLFLWACRPARAHRTRNYPEHSFE